MEDRLSTRRALEARLVEVFCNSGCVELEVPYLEEWETLEVASDPQLRERAVKVIDAQGGVKVLRPDFTASVARMVTRELSRTPRPLRVFYSGTVFRRADPKRLEPQEFGQAGVEIIGNGDACLGLDLECVRLAVKSLLEARLTEFTLVLSHSSLIPCWLALCGARPDEVQHLKTLLVRHDLVALRAALAQGAIASSAMSFLRLRGGAEAVARGRALASPLLQGNAEARQFGDQLMEALDDLETICREVSKIHAKVSCIVDMGLARELDYYTGMVFDVCAAGLGRPIGGGGRYDGLMSKFGNKEAARGFAFRMDRVAEALTRE